MCHSQSHTSNRLTVYIGNDRMASQVVHEFTVSMSCEGCSAAVNRVLGRLQGVTKVEFDMEAQKVFVESSLTSDELLATIKKTGRECSYVGVKK